MVTLTANVSKSGYTSQTKSFTFTVLKETKTDMEAVIAALDAITFDTIKGGNTYQSEITKDLSLPTTGLYNTILSWSSSNTNVVNEKGTVTRKSVDTSAVLTATAKKGDKTGTKTFSLTVKGTTDPDELDLESAKQALTDKKVLNGNVDRKNIIGDLYLPSSLSGATISWNSSNTTYFANNGSVFRSTLADKSLTLTATLSKNSKSTTKVFDLTIKKKEAPIEVVGGKATVDAGKEEVVMDNTNAGSLNTIEIPSTVDKSQEIVLNLDALRANDGSLTLSSSSLDLTRNSDGLAYKAAIPQSTVITGPANWNGLIKLPTIKSNSEVSAGSSNNVDFVIEMGLAEGGLTFSKAVKITVPGKAGQFAGYQKDSVFYTINACTASQIADPETLPAGGDCYTTSGSDLIILTKHFTMFTTYTTSASGGSSTSRGPSGGSSSGLVGASDSNPKENVVITPRTPVTIPGSVVPETSAPEVAQTSGESNELTGAVVGGGISKGLKGALIITGIVVVGLAGYVIIRRKYKTPPEKGEKPS